jgi:membrane protein
MLRFARMLKRAIEAWLADYAPSMGAAISYYTLFSIAPLLIIVIGVAGLLFDQTAVRREILEQLRDLLGQEGASAVEILLRRTSDPATSGIAAVVGTVALLIGATTVFHELQSALDRIWRVPARPTVPGWFAWIRGRFLSFGLILGIGFLVTVSLVLSAVLAAAGAWWNPLFGEWLGLLRALNFLTGFVVVTVLFAMIYKILPSVSISWRDVWIGAAVTALLFNLGKVLIGLYLGTAGVTSAFGAAGSFAVLLVWVYYSAQVFLLGAEFTWVYTHEAGSMAAAHRAAGGPPAPHTKPGNSA